MKMPALQKSKPEIRKPEFSLLVLGIGNMLLGDEGIGVQVIKMLESEEMPSGVRVLDGGTGGFSLLGELSAFDKVIIIDATTDEDAPGSIKIVKPRYATDFPQCLSAHEFGLKDMIDSLEFLGQLPEITLVVISIEKPTALSTALSPAVKAAVPRIISIVHKLIAKETSG